MLVLALVSVMVIDTIPISFTMLLFPRMVDHAGQGPGGVVVASVSKYSFMLVTVLSWVLAKRVDSSAVHVWSCAYMLACLQWQRGKSLGEVGVAVLPGGILKSRLISMLFLHWLKNAVIQFLRQHIIVLAVLVQ